MSRQASSDQTIEEVFKELPNTVKLKKVKDGYVAQVRYYNSQNTRQEVAEIANTPGEALFGLRDKLSQDEEYQKGKIWRN